MRSGRGWEAPLRCGRGRPPGDPGDPSGGPGGVWKTSRRSKRGSRNPYRVWESLPEVQEGSGGPHRGPGGVGRPSRRSGRGPDTLSRFRRDWEAI